MFSAIGCTLFFYNFGAGCDMHKAFESFERASDISALVILPVEYSHSTFLPFLGTAWLGMAQERHPAGVQT
jgi:hypothetical protein